MKQSSHLLIATTDYAESIVTAAYRYVIGTQMMGTPITTSLIHYEQSTSTVAKKVGLIITIGK